MHRGALLASGSTEDIRREFGRSERTLTISLLNRIDGAVSWLESQLKVHNLIHSGNDATFGFRGGDEDQAALLAGLIGAGFPVKAFDEKTLSFEDILIEVASDRHH